VDEPPEYSSTFPPGENYFADPPPAYPGLPEVTSLVGGSLSEHDEDVITPIVTPQMPHQHGDNLSQE